MLDAGRQEYKGGWGRVRMRRVVVGTQGTNALCEFATAPAPDLIAQRQAAYDPEL
jgi:hypothetical protein